MSAPYRIAFFGGTFDPVHLGHLEIAKKAKQALQLNEVVFIPCQQSPHKDTGPLASAEERFHMLTLACRKLPWARLSRYEIQAPPPSYTWKTLETLIPLYPKETQAFLLIGDDQWAALPSWKHPERIAQQVQFIVVGRNHQAQAREGYRAHFLKGDHPASASEIRALLAHGKKPPWLDPFVYTYLNDSKIYQK